MSAWPYPHNRARGPSAGLPCPLYVGHAPHDPERSQPVARALPLGLRRRRHRPRGQRGVGPSKPRAGGGCDAIERQFADHPLDPADRQRDRGVSGGLSWVTGSSVTRESMYFLGALPFRVSFAARATGRPGITPWRR
jgi:hypothetical protein